MVNIRINDLPEDDTPNASDFVPVDATSTRKTTIADLVTVGRPLASQAEAEAGTDPSKAMTPLTTAQAIEAQRPSGATGLALLLSGTAADARGVLGVGVTGENVFLANTAADIRALLDLEPGTDVQAQSATLQEIADLTPGADGTILGRAGGAFAYVTAGTGDMAASVYDPQGKAGDPFPYDTEADFVAANIPASIDSVQTRGYYAPGDGGGHIKVRIATPTPVEPWHKQSADGAWWEIADSNVDARVFGATGDGLADDTIPLQNWLDFPGSRRKLSSGVFRLTGTLTSSADGRKIWTDGATLFCDVDDITALLVTGDNCEICVKIDGNEKGALGVDVTGSRCSVFGCDIRDLYGKIIGAAAIRVQTTGGVRVFDNFIKNITAQGNGTTGDNPGSARGVLLAPPAESTEWSYVTDNVIDIITGEEGDGIQVLAFDGTFPFLSGKVVIKNNIVNNCTRRAIKIQSSDIIVQGNDNYNTIDTTGALASINVLQSNRVFVVGNTMRIPGAVTISVVGTTGVRCNEIYIADNYCERNAVATAMFLEFINDLVVKNNKVKGGLQGVSLGTVVRGVVEGNIFTGGAGDNPAINATANCSSLTIARNKVLEGSRLYCVQNAAPNCIIEDNHSEVGACIRTFATAAGTRYSRNTNRSASNTVIGDVTNQIVADTQNLGSGTSGGLGGAVFYTTAIPSTAQPGTRHNRGDVAINALAASGQPAIWICLTAGTPGTWAVIATAP